MTSARVRAIVGACALVAASGAWAGPGAAPASASVCSLTIDPPQPRVVETTSIELTGSFVTTEAAPRLEVYLSGPGRPEATPVEAKLTEPGRYSVPLAGLSHNGTYTAQVVAIDDVPSEAGCDGGPGEPRMEDEVTFAVNVPAQPPVNVRSRFEAGPRTAVVTWERSPDPDTLHYGVIRRVGRGAFEPMARVPRDALSWTDTSLPAGAATVTYAVSSARNGINPQSSSPLSVWVVAAPLDVPAPATPGPAGPATQPATGGPTPGTAAAGPLTTASTPVTPARSGRAAAPRAGVADPGNPVDLTEAPAGDEASPFTLPPWADGEEGQVQVIEESGDQPAVGGGGGTGRRGVPALAYVAAGLLSAVVAAHFLWLRRQALQPDEEATEAGLPVEAVGAASAVAGERPASPPSVLESLGEAPEVALPEAAPTPRPRRPGRTRGSAGFARAFAPGDGVAEGGAGRGASGGGGGGATPGRGGRVVGVRRRGGAASAGADAAAAAAWLPEAPEVAVPVEGPEIAPAAEAPEVDLPVESIRGVGGSGVFAGLVGAVVLGRGGSGGAGGLRRRSGASAGSRGGRLSSDVAVPVEAPEVDLPVEAVAAPASSDEVAPPTEPAPPAAVESEEVPEPTPAAAAAAPLADEGPPEPPAPRPHPVIVLRPLPRVRADTPGPAPNDQADVEALV